MHHTVQEATPEMLRDLLGDPDEHAKTPLACLNKMQEASSAFYTAAVASNCHAFVEFTGLMNEYIKVCEQSHAEGIDFMHSNVHGSKHAPPLAWKPWNADYVGEKLECIFGPLAHTHPPYAKRIMRAFTDASEPVSSPTESRVSRVVVKALETAIALDVLRGDLVARLRRAINGAPTP